MSNVTTPIILLEWDIPTDRNDWVNYEAGIWFWTLTPGAVVVADDNGGTGFYTWQNSEFYNVQSLRVDSVNYSKVYSLADCRSTNNSFYYDTSTTYLYVHFNNYDPPLYTNGIFIGVATGVSLGNRSSGYYYNDVYYEPRLKTITPVKRNKDPLFYGILKYQSGKADIINTDGDFDDWRSRNLYGQGARILYGDVADTYDNLEVLFNGFIENDQRDWDTMSVTIQDNRKSLTQPVARNLLNQTDWPNMTADNVDKPKPVAYGKIYNAESLCLSENGSSPYTFLICDTEFNSVSSLDAVYVSGAAVSPGGVDLTAGTFTLTSGQVGTNFSDVTIDYTMPIVNGVSIITDLMTNYGNTPLIASFYDTTEITEAVSLSRNTSLLIDDDTKLYDAIEQICYDIDGVFFQKHGGLYTVRIYDVNRTPIRTIYNDEWIGKPKIVNNGNEFLTSAVIGYKPDRAADKYIFTENTDYESSAFDIYKRYKKETFETGLYTLADATDKADTILTFSSQVEDIITRRTKFQNRDIDIMDFIICDPTRRHSEADTFKVYEVIGIMLDHRAGEVEITMRYVKDYTPTEYAYSLRVTTAGDFRVTTAGDSRLVTEII